MSRKNAPYLATHYIRMAREISLFRSDLSSAR